MSKIKAAIAKESTSWVDVPGIEGFEVHLRFLTREDLTKIRDRSTSFKFSKKTHQREDETDSAKFLEIYAGKAIIDWRGFKVKHLVELFPADISSMDPEETLEYDEEDALALLKNSTIFDQFITDTMNDFEQFSVTKSEEETKN